MQLGDALSIAGLYLALVGLLSTFFFVQLGQWLNGILGNASRWNQVKNRTPKPDFYDSRLECYYDAVRSSSVWTLFGWLAVTAFLVTIGVFLELLRTSLDQAGTTYVFFYVSLPSYIFMAIYLALSSPMLVIGYSKARRVRDSAKAKL